MKTPAQAWAFAIKQMASDTPPQLKTRWHYGNMEVAALLEFIFELAPGTPFDPKAKEYWRAAVNKGSTTDSLSVWYKANRAKVSK